MEVDSGTPADQEAMLPRGPHPDDAFRDDDSSSFGSAASQHDDASSLDDDAAMPAHALPHQSRHAMPAAAASDVDADDASDEDDEEEAECRVCRGPAEEGRPLYSPCKCSGSIGLCHQDCLTSWLEVTHGGGGRCELCSYRFRFRPLYAPGAPERLPPHEVLLGLGRSAVVKFLPYLLRIGLSLGVWLVVLPLCSAYLYQGWFHSPKSVASRWQTDLLLRDGVSGAIVAAIVVVSFLSLMSLADFMRFQWNPDAQEANAEEQEAAEEARAEDQMAAIRAGGIGAMRDAVEAIAAENGIDLEAEERARGFVRDDRRQEEAAMPDPFELDAEAELDRHHHHHHHPHHHRNQRQRQRDLVPPVAYHEDNMQIHGHDTMGIDEDDAADARARRQMERIRGRIEDRRRQNRDVLERENSRPMSPDISEAEEDDDLHDNIRDYATAAANRRYSNHEADVLLPLGSPLESWSGPQGGTDEAGEAPPSPTHSRPGSLSSLPSLHRDAVGVMDEGEPFFSNDRMRARTRFADDDDEELRRRRRLLAERAALRRQGEDDYGIGLKNDYEEDDDLVEDESGEASSEPLSASEMEDDDMSDIAFDQAETEEQSYFSDNPINLTPPPEDVDMMDPDEADLENMMRLQEEAMLDLDSDDEDGDNVDANPNAPAAPVAAQQGQPQNAGGRFEPQFEPLDPGFEQEEEMDMEFQLALDELLGFRGPVGALLRNILFFLAFITTYLGLFGFVPYQLGSFASRSRLLSFLARPLASATRRVFDLLHIMVNVHFNVATVATNASDATVANLTTAMNSLNASNVINLTESFAFPTVFTALASESAPTTERTAAEAAAEAAANISYVAQQINGIASLPDASVIFFRMLDFESRVWNCIFRLPDIMKLVLGYFVIGTIVMMLQALIAYIAKKPADPHHQLPPRRLEPIPLNAEQQAAAERLGLNFDDDNGQDAAALQEELQNQDEYIEIKLTVVLDYARAVMKVCMLLFLKMVILPLTLGFSLDLATLELFNATVQSRVLHAGKDLFGSLLVHWVAGITFMLLVTVSVLQLREVIHPDLLARVVRPQEPQPDLLGNMLKERGFTHARRMLLSLSIYLGLLVVNVWAPSKLLIISGLSRSIPVFQPKIWHVVIPQLQIPIELLVFHLSMLAFLEKYKNCIGMLQHKWLVAVCDVMGLTDYMIPREVAKFNLIASKPVFRQSSLDSPSSSFDSEGDSVPPLDEATIITQSTSASASTLTRNHDALPVVAKKSRQYTKPSSSSSTPKVLDPFWSELMSMGKDKKISPESIDDFIIANIRTNNGDLAETGRWTSGVTTDAGKRVLDVAEESIDLPERPTDSKLWPFYEDGDMGKTSDASATAVLPTAIGAYRFRLRSSAGGMATSSGAPGNVIEIWKEDCGAPIPRPPEGWDDLGVGGAEVQGRWAWDKEKKSTIEEGVAHRSTFFGSAKDGETRLASALRRWPTGLFLSSKVAILMFMSWLAMSTFVCGGITAPLIAGRFIYFLLQVPDRFMHDPIAYTAGAMVVFPFLVKIVRIATGSREEGQSAFAAWRSGFCLPPRGSYKLRYIMQASCLWTIVIPLLLGLAYHLFLIKGTSFWLYKESPFNGKDMSMSWGVGTLLLNSWAVLCYHGAFKLGFWLDLIAGPPQEPDAAAQPQPAANGGAPNVVNAAANDADGDNGAAEEPQIQPEPVAAPLLWQGQDGFVGRMVDTMFAVLGKWEWDKVDRDILLTQTLVPITQQLLILLVGPIFAYLGWSALLSALTHGRGSAGIILPFVGLVEKDVYRRFFYRCFAITTVLIQLASTFQSSMQRWFRAAHKAARDDRYLQGEVLVNYVR